MIRFHQNKKDNVIKTQKGIAGIILLRVVLNFEFYFYFFTSSIWFSACGDVTRSSQDFLASITLYLFRLPAEGNLQIGT